MNLARIYPNTCPICGGNKKKEQKGCFHCARCEIFEACNYTDDPIAEYLDLIKQRLVTFYQKVYAKDIKNGCTYVDFMKKYEKYLQKMERARKKWEKNPFNLKNSYKKVKKKDA
jgi:hypothetical protein